MPRSNPTERSRSIKKEAKDLLGGICVVCGTAEDLDFDHVDPKTKLFKISNGYRYSDEAFWLEVAKCQLLCRPHHEEKSALEGSQSQSGERNPRSKLRSLDVVYIRGLSDLGYSSYAISREFEIDPSTVRAIVRRDLWKIV